MMRAANDAGTDLNDIAFVITSGSAAEADISLPCVDIKKVTGETFSASAAIAAAAASAICQRGRMPDGTPLGEGKKYVMINSFGNDGYIGCMVLGIMSGEEF